jgi:multidrug transporter EmrE-like cation transporter
MTPTNTFLLFASTITFVGAASAAKAWALSANSIAWLVLTLVLYTLGNLIMLRLIRDVGMGVALSLSAVVQLVAVNVVALAVFGERVSAVQAGGLFLAVLAVAMITLGPS